MVEAGKALVSAYLSWEQDRATQASLERLASRLDELVRQIQQNYQSILNTLLALHRDALKGRLQATIDQFRLIHRMSQNAREIFQNECAYLTGELTVLASNRTDYNVFLYPYDFITMLGTLAPIHAFANRAAGYPEVRYIFDRPYQLTQAYMKMPYGGDRVCALGDDPNIWCDPGFQDRYGDVNVQFRNWLDTELHPFSRLLIEGHWGMVRSDFPYGFMFPSVNGKPIPTLLNSNHGENMSELARTLRTKPQWRPMWDMKQSLKHALDTLPRLATEAAPMIDIDPIEENQEPTCALPPSPRLIEACQRAGLFREMEKYREADRTETLKREREKEAGEANPSPSVVKMTKTTE